MKLFRYIFSACVLAAALAACNTKEALDNPVVTTAQGAYEIPAEGGDIPLVFHSNMPWKITVAPGNSKSDITGIRVTPSSGNASQREITVTIHAGKNEGAKRVAIISILGTQSESAVRLTQNAVGATGPSKGIVALPFKASELFDFLKGGDTPEDEVFVTGTISKMGTFNEKYGSQVYWITDDGRESDKALQVYGGLQFDGAKFPADQSTAGEAAIIKVGDVVMVRGKAKLYKDSPEMDSNNVLISVNGKAAPAGEGTLESPYNVAKAIDLVNTGKQPSDPVYVQGFISQIDKAFSSYGDAQYWISDDGTIGHQMEVYQGLYLKGEKFTEEGQINLGDKVKIIGKIVPYKDIVEFSAKSEIVELNGKTE